MTLSARWTDPKNGAYYATGDRFLTNQWNQFAGGMRALDNDLTLAAVRNMTVTSLGAVVPNAAVHCPDTGSHIVVGATAGVPKVSIIGTTNDVVSGLVSVVLTTDLDDIAVSDGGVIVTGGPLSGATASKWKTSSDYGLTWSAITSGTVDDHGPAALAYMSSPVNLFVAGTSGTGNATIYSGNSTGTVWTSRTNPLTNTGWRGSNRGGIAFGNGTVCLMPTGSHANLAYSTDGTTYSAAALPSTATWLGQAYTPRWGWLAVSQSLDFADSTDATSWSAASVAVAPSGASAAYSIHSLGNMYILYALQSIDKLFASVDGGATWETITAEIGASMDSVCVSGGRLYWLGSLSPSGEVAIVSDRMMV